MRLSSKKQPQRILTQVSAITDPDKQWQSFCVEIKKSMTGTSEEKQSVLRKRILKFFNNYSLDKNRFYVERREVGSNGLQSINISSNSILMYGIDFLTENKLEEYFYPFSISIQFYDDSHCSVTFEHLQSLIQAAYNRMIPNYEIGNIGTFKQIVTSNMQNRLKWFELKPYFQLGFERNLWFRFLTSEDYENKNSMGKSALSESFLIAKSNFLQEIRIKNESNFNNNFQNKRQRSSSSQSKNSRERSRDSRYQNKYDSQNQFCRRCQGMKMRPSYWNKNDKSGCFHKENKRYISKDQKAYDEESENRSNNFVDKNSSLKSQRKYKHQNYKTSSPMERLTSINSSLRKSAISRQRQQPRDSFRFDAPLKRSNISDQSDDSLMLNSLVDQLEKYTFEEDSKKFESNLSQIKICSSQNQTKTSMKSDCMKMQEELSIFQVIEQE